MEIPVGVEVLLLIFTDGHGRDLAAVVSHEPLPQFRRQATTEFAFGHLDPRFLHGERHGRKKTTRLLLSLAMAIRSCGCPCFVARKPPPTPTTTRCSPTCRSQTTSSVPPRSERRSATLNSASRKRWPRSAANTTGTSSAVVRSC